ncbi:glycosyltransferase family 69 protein [Parathielavia hyrcaniae]|uniref:Glycosyltransferase family 69 protein n=1 Tax=Parathielavia hyrcaniae TaxID=113614 RepID=A0AAN6PS01_9PEZI|nr:glycosyltransferase family 69 protein [Parathielavia hyrcaniae]
MFKLNLNLNFLKNPGFNLNLKSKYSIIAQITALCLVVLYFLFSYARLNNWSDSFGNGPLGASTRVHSFNPSSIDFASYDPPMDPELGAKAAFLIPPILDRADTSVERMSCPQINVTRYGYLRPHVGWWKPKQTKYVFALNLRKIAPLLPRLLGSVVEVMRFLGPKYCALSIIEGNSDDGTLEALRLLGGELEKIGVDYWLARSSLDPLKGERMRIKKLAMLRQMAIEPLSGPVEILHGKNGTPPEVDPGQLTYYSKPAIEKLDMFPNATVAFINDVSACEEDILELIHQREFQDADMTCGMDWNDPDSGNSLPGPTPTFYDVWVARSMSGSMFFDIPLSGSWENSKNLFWDHPATQHRFNASVPFQVFACWNGAVAVAAEPFASGEVAFRASRPGECYQGEPELLCKDLWWLGRGRIAAVPGVNLGYNDGKWGRWIKEERGYVSDVVRLQSAREAEWGVEERIQWEEKPPEMVNCVETWTKQEHRPWNESLTLRGI